VGQKMRSLRRRLLTPNVVECSLGRRGFHRKNADAHERLETVGAMFLRGYAHAVEARDQAEARDLLEAVPAPWRGFAYEGAGMGAAVLDGLPFGRSDNVRSLLEGSGDRHIYMIYVGIGWAMARLPRLRWPSAASFDPLLRGLVLDGYGFHQAYFHTDRYVHQQYRQLPFAWPDDATARHSHHTVDQGIGRALWFVGGTDVETVTTLIERFPAGRKADLYAGTGLAATYAGGVDASELALLRERAGPFGPQLAQASAFAAEARLRAGNATEHTAVATGVLCGTTPREAASITLDLRPAVPDNTDLPAYEAWRRAVIDRLAVGGGVPS
jgi:enediyne biosynthesis protein E3